MTAGNSDDVVKDNYHIFQTNVVDSHWGMRSSSTSVTADYSNFAEAPSFDEAVALVTASGGKGETLGSRFGRLVHPCKTPDR